MPDEEHSADFYKGPAYALVIGIREHKHGKDTGELEESEFPNLKVADKDASDFADFLKDKGFIKFNVQRLINEEAKLASIKDEFETLRKNCKQSGTKDPLVIIYFSGHGWYDDELGRYYLIPYDAERNKLHSTAFRDRDFRLCLEDLDTNRLVVFLDACHAGAIGVPGQKGLPQDFHKDLGAGEGRYFIASCGPGEKSYEWKQKSNSIFTGHLLELLRCDTNDFDQADSPEIDIFDLYPILRDKVKETALKEYGKEQIPLSEMKGGRGIILAISPKVRHRKLREQELGNIRAFLELICGRIKARSTGSGPKYTYTIATRLQSYVLKGSKAKGFDDFYNLFEEQVGEWRRSTETYSMEDGCNLLIDSYEFVSTAAPASKEPSTQETVKPVDNFVPSAEKPSTDVQDVWPQAKDPAQAAPVLPPKEGSLSPNVVQVKEEVKSNNVFNVRMQAVKGDPIETPRSKVFISYSHKDKKWLNDLQTMMAPLIHKHAIDLWDDTKIEPGTLWRDEIEKALASTKVAVLLVSANFLASDFIVNKELPPLLNEARDKGVTIYWMKISACLVDTTEIIDYQAAHDVSRPLDQMNKPDRQAVLSDVCSKIQKLLAD